MVLFVNFNDKNHKILKLFLINDDHHLILILKNQKLNPHRSHFLVTGLSIGTMIDKYRLTLAYPDFWLEEKICLDLYSFGGDKFNICLNSVSYIIFLMLWCTITIDNYISIIIDLVIIFFILYFKYEL